MGLHDRSTALAGLRGGAHELQRAAGAMQKHASALEEEVPTPAVLAHLEEALDRLEVTVHMLSTAVPQDESDETAALRWHLAELGRRLRASGEACASSRRWAAGASEEPERPALPARPPGAISLVVG